MKKVFALVLAFALVLSFGVVAFAAPSPTAPGSGGSEDLGWGDFTTRVPPVKNGLEIYDKDGKLIRVVPGEDVVQVPVDQADKLPEADKKAFLDAYEEAKNRDDAVVKYFYWVDVPDQYKTGDGWFKYEFKCAGDDVQVTVNGKPMEVVHIDGVNYYAKLTELGALAILVGLPKEEADVTENGMELYNADDEKYDTVPADAVIEVGTDNADALNSADQEAFLAAVEAAAAVENKTAEVKWVDVPDQYKTDELAWAKYEFSNDGENVEATVNGEPVEVVADGDGYYAKLTDFGAVAVFCD